MEDREIIDLYWLRSERAIEETAKKYAGYCRAVAFRVLRDDRDSEECVNDTWLGAWRAMPPKRPEVLSTFLGKITRNLALDRYRQSRAEKRGFGQVPVALEELAECVPAAGGVEAAVEEAALAQALSRFVGTLPREQGRFFVQRYWYLCSIREIAEENGVSVSKVKMSLFRARESLRICLEKEGVIL